MEKRKRPTREDKPLNAVAKIAGHVFDDKTIDVIMQLKNIKVIEGLDYPISEGKESIVFKGRSKSGDVAVKIFKYETSSFLKRSMLKYVEGDPRFPSLNLNHRSLVKLWARKEFANLIACAEAEVPAPLPVKQRENVVVMQFLGVNGIPYSLLKDCPLGEVNVQNLFDQVIVGMQKFWNRGLVHADLNEFNLLTDGTNIWFIDFAQAVKKEHPLALKFLEKDCENIAVFFKKKGIDTTKEEILKTIIKH